jgi:nicotinate phosphoribosyltransferase
MAGLEKDGKIINKMKISENVEKITNPGYKKVYRLYNKDTGRMIADVITLASEEAPSGDDYVIFDPSFTWKRQKLSNFISKELQVQIFDKGKLVYECPSLEEIRKYCLSQIDTLWEETLRFENPQPYYVDLSKELWALRTELIEDHQKA